MATQKPSAKSIYDAGVASKQAGFSNEDIMRGAINQGLNADDVISAYSQNRPDLFGPGLPQMDTHVRELESRIRGTPAPTTAPTTAALVGPSSPVQTQATPMNLDPATVGQWYKNYAAQNPTSSRGYTTDKWNVTDDQTVAGNVRALIEDDSPLMQRQAAKADGIMNARGLVSTTMGAEAAQNAVYDHALQIATPDALTKRTAGQYNVDQSNRAKEFEAAAGNTLQLNELGARTQMGTALIGAETSRYGTDVQAASQKYASDTQRYGTDVAARTEIQRANIAADSAKYGVDVGSMTSLQQSAIAAQSSKTVAEINRDSSWATANLTADTQRAVATMTAASQQLVATINADSSKYIAGLDTQTKLQVAEFANANQLLLNTNTQATSAFNQAMAAISTIQNNAAMDANTKAEGLSAAWKMLESQFKTIGAVAPLRLSDILDYAPTPTQTQTPAPSGGSGWSPGEGGP